MPYTVLSYGAIGLGLLLAGLAYRLLSRVNNTKSPVPIYVFMVFCVVLVGIGAWLQYEASNYGQVQKNYEIIASSEKKKDEQIAELSQANNNQTTIINQDESELSARKGELERANNTMNEQKDEIVKLGENIKTTTIGLQERLDKASTGWNECIRDNADKDKVITLCRGSDKKISDSINILKTIFSKSSEENTKEALMKVIESLRSTESR